MRSLSLTVAAVTLLVSASADAAPSRMSDVRAVEAVLARYSAALESLDPRGTEALFATDSEIFESGGSEGSYANYLQHHLGPELAEFRSFRFFDHKVSVRFEGHVALATETYRFRIEPKTGDPAERLGVATSVLRKTPGGWKIVSMHNSARRPRGS